MSQLTTIQPGIVFRQIAARPPILVGAQSIDFPMLAPDLATRVGSPVTQFQLANNQSSPADITGWLIDPTQYITFVATYCIRLVYSSPTTDILTTGEIRGQYRSTVPEWELGAQVSMGDTSGIVFSMLSSGQMQYTSTGISGTQVTSFIRFYYNAF